MLSAFRQEQARVATLENEIIEMRNANKVHISVSYVLTL